MKFIALAAAAALIAAPAAAQTNTGFVGPRAETFIGYNDVDGTVDRNDVVYGFAAGFDLPVDDRATIGLEVNTRNTFERQRQVGGTIRVGYALTTDTLGYALGGYNNYRAFERNADLDGYVVGGGFEHRLSDRTFVKAEYRYSDFNRGVTDNAGTVGFGIRF